MSVTAASQNIVWVNGEYLSGDAIPISATAAGLNVGLGVFDSLCAYEGVPFDYAKHYQRLANAAGKLGLAVGDEETLYQALLGVVEKNGFSVGKCRLRITVLASAGEPVCIVSAAAFPERAELSSCIIGASKVNEFSPLAGIKSTCYALNYFELQEAQIRNADESILCNTRNLLCEGATSNIFVVKAGVVKTPALSSGCLPGVARDTVMELCSELGISCVEEDLTIADLLESDEAFLTSSLREVQGIAEVDNQKLAVAPGLFTQQLRAAYKHCVAHGA